MRKILALFTAIIICLGATAQERKPRGPRFSPEEFEQKLHEFVCPKAGFTPQEEEDFFRLHKEMRLKQQELQKQIGKLKCPKTEEASDKEMARRVVKIAELEEECADIKKDYYEKMARVIPGRKLHKAILAEDAFHRQMLRHVSPRHGHRRIEGSSAGGSRK